MDALWGWMGGDGGALAFLGLLVGGFLELNLRLALATVASGLLAWAWVWLPPVVVCGRLPGGARGLAQPGLVVLSPHGFMDEGVLRHELEHIRQMRRLSPYGVAAFLGLHYGGGMLAAARRGQRAAFCSLYLCNPLEREANEAMSRADPLLRHWRVGRSEAPLSMPVVYGGLLAAHVAWVGGVLALALLA